MGLRRRSWGTILGVLLLILAATLFAPTGTRLSLAAAPTVQWSKPARIPGYSAKTEPPYLVADRNKTVHAFHSQPVGKEVAIVYSKWQLPTGWTAPVDIILSPRPFQAMVESVLLDSEGILHLVFYGGDDKGGDLYYSSAAALDAANTRAWSTPKLLAQNIIFSPAIKLAGDDKGKLYALFGGSSSGNGLYVVQSTDRGKTWSSPSVVSLTDDPETFPGTLALYLESNAQLHVAWSVWRDPIGGEDLYYARLDTVHNGWTMPVLLPHLGGSPDYPVLFPYHDKIFLIYQENWTVGRMIKIMRQSSDRGRTWTDAIPAFPPLAGGNGGAVLLVDSNDVLHAILANRIDDSSHGVWHSVWEGDHWSDVQPIITGSRSSTFGPTIPQATLLQGNIILATWISEGAYTGVWYSYARLNVPELAVESLPTPKPSSTPSATPTALIQTPTAAPTAVPLAKAQVEAPTESESSPTLPLLAATFPVLILIGLVILIRTRN